MEDDMTIDRLIANFMTASTPLEKYLLKGQPLTALQLQSVSTTLDGLRISLDTWGRKDG